MIVIPLISICHSYISIFSPFVVIFILELLKNCLALCGIINYSIHWYIFTVLVKTLIVFDLKFDSFLFDGIKFFDTNL